ncbi:SDR family NAD(P)-dependent oxidoreductase, partial [Nonomuraea deserti]|uniref:SDR family NAD(P)-dependent oxidoreductase n=1 Tax=Nonomuraea deserti TaxID=1848322 RepID=UPI001C6FE17E
MSGRTAIVASAGHGIGHGAAAASCALSRAGASVVLAARDGQALAALAADLGAAGGQAVAVPTDLASPVSVRRLVEQTLGAFGRLDAACNDIACHATACNAQGSLYADGSGPAGRPAAPNDTGCRTASAAACNDAGCRAASAVACNDAGCRAASAVACNDAGCRAASAAACNDAGCRAASAAACNDAGCRAAVSNEGGRCAVASSAAGPGAAGCRAAARNGAGWRVVGCQAAGSCVAAGCGAASCGGAECGAGPRAAAGHDAGCDCAAQVRGLSLALKYEIEAMRRTGGCVVNLAPSGGPQAAVIELTRKAALDLAGSGVRVNAVATGPLASQVAGPLVGADVGLDLGSGGGAGGGSGGGADGGSGGGSGGGADGGSGGG